MIATDLQLKNVIGVLKPIAKTTFTLYDNPSNYDDKSQTRREHGTFLYRYEPTDAGLVRRVKILLPSVYHHSGQNIYQVAQNNPKVVFT